MSLYDDEELAPQLAFPDNITFAEVGDRVRGRVERMEKIDTRYGKVAKYWIFDLDNNAERTMLAGATDLWRQLHKLRPEIGDIVEIEMTGNSGRMMLFDVQVSQELPLDHNSDEPF